FLSPQDTLHEPAHFLAFPTDPFDYHPLTMWDMRTKQPHHWLFQPTGPNGIDQVAFSTDGQKVTAVGPDGIGQWDAKTGNVLFSSSWGLAIPDDNILLTTVSPNGQFAVVAESECTGGSCDSSSPPLQIRLWNVATEKFVDSLTLDHFGNLVFCPS